MITVIAAATENEMIATFLRAGLDSPREREALMMALGTHSVSVDAIRAADTTNAAANRARSQVLADWYGWGRSPSLFDGLPDDVEWTWVDLEEEALRERVFTIDYYFQDTLGTRALAEIVEEALRDDPEYWIAVVQTIRGGHRPEAPILLTDDGGERLVILDGHTRMLAYLAHREAVEFPIRALLGVSARISEWSEW